MDARRGQLNARMTFSGSTGSTRIVALTFYVEQADFAEADRAVRDTMPRREP